MPFVQSFLLDWMHLSAAETRGQTDRQSDSHTNRTTSRVVASPPAMYEAIHRARMTPTHLPAARDDGTTDAAESLRSPQQRLRDAITVAPKDPPFVQTILLLVGGRLLRYILRADLLSLEAHASSYMSVVNVSWKINLGSLCSQNCITNS